MVGATGNSAYPAGARQIPSSSGNGLQLEYATCLANCGSSFQSPPHRGTVCNQISLLLLEGSGVIISVPSSSGNGLQLEKPLPHQPTVTVISVPSSSGNGLQPGSRPPHLPGPCRFQSPPHRGTVCNPRSSQKESPAKPVISVPSSSGNGLQLCGHTGRAWRHRRLSVPSSSGNGLQLGRAGKTPPGASYFQSPPHRGTVCNNRTRALQAADPAPFQSPPHRGTVCNFGKRITEPEARAFYFSPLLIGERSATSFKLLVHDGPPCISVPSSSGNGLQRSLLVKFEPVFVAFQSPPHRGTVCN